MDVIKASVDALRNAGATIQQDIHPIGPSRRIAILRVADGEFVA